MTTTTTAATTPAPAYGPATDIAVAENAGPAAAGQADPYATHPNPTTKETIPMTDQPAPEVTDEDRRIASDWAESVHSYPDTWTDRLRAAARVILHDVPAPPLPTLADMTPEERDECQWMQADTKTWGRVVIAVPTLSGARASLLDRWGDGAYEDHANVTPRPDLPRLEWPGDKKPAPALPGGWRLADHQKHGRVIVTTTEPDQDGDIFFVYKPNRGHGSDKRWCKPAALTFLDQEADQ